MTSSHEEPISEPIAVRQAQFPGVPTSSISGSKTTTSPSGAIRAPQSDPPPSTTWPGGGIVASITNLEMSGNTNSPKPTAPRNRCFVEHLRANLERTGEDVVDELGVKKTGTKLVVDLPDAQAGHNCCDMDAQLDLMPLHPDQHDPKGPDGIHETVELIKRNGKSLLVTEIEMRAVAAATAKESNKGDDDVVAADFTVVSLKDAMTSKRIVTPGKGSKCTHIECFDLETFLRATLRATRFSQRTKCANTTKFPTCHPHHTELKKLGRCDYCKHWRCPICRQALSLSELEYDAFTGNILEKEPNAERVKVKPSTSEFWLEVVPVTAKPAPRNETDSDNTDSDDESPGPSREYEMRQKSSDTTEPGWKRETEHTLVMKSSKQGSVARTASEATETPRNGVDVIELDDSDDEAEGDVEMPQVHEQEEPSGPNSAPAVAAETGTGSIPTMATTNANKRASDDVDTSPPMDPRQPKIARRAIATIAPLDPVGAAARPTATTTTTVTVGAAPPIPKRLPPATVDEDLFRRVGAVLKTVQTNCDASTGTKWCQKASIPKTNEFIALEQLTKWMEALYDMTCKLTGQNRDSLKIALTSHSTGVHFQKFRKRVRLNKLLEPHNPVAPKIHNALELMAHTRNFWKAIVRREQLPKPLIKDGNGKFKVDPLEGWEGANWNDTSNDRSVSPGTSNKGSKGTKRTKGKSPAKEKKTKGKKGKSPVSPSMGGAAKKFAANALPVSRVTTQKAKEKRRLPTYCDARGHGHCEWDGVTPLKEHPKLKHVWICVGCYDFYHAMHFTVGKDGYYNQCRCCSDGGGDDVIVCCDTCAQVFCKNCIANLGGKEYCNDVGKVDTWRCFSCDPKAVAKKR